MEYKELSATQIESLRAQGCRCENWQDVRVKAGFSTSHVYNVHFSGKIRLGVFDENFVLEGGLVKHSGMRCVTLHNCTVGDNCLIENVPNYIANYDIQNDVFIENVNLMVVDGVSRFGNGVRVSVLNETGGREVAMFDGMSAQLAYVMALYRYRPELIERLYALVDGYATERASERGVVALGARIVNTGTIRNVRVGEFAEIDGVSRLENGSINSSQQAPVMVGHNVIATDFIFSSGAHVTDGAVMVRVFVGQACHLGHLFSAHDSLFFSNCQCENGEACAIFAGPYTVTMHKSSLLIAGMFSFLNAGSGSNQSNHMYKLGPIHQGVVERGSKTTSDSYVLWPARIGPFSLVMGRHVNHPDTSDLPFSYLIERADETYLVPAVNLRSVGTIRDSQKWPKRDRRTDVVRLDMINFNLLSPYTVSKMMRGIDILRNLQSISGESSAEYSYNNTHIRNGSLVRGIALYGMAIDKFLGNSLLKRLENMTFDNVEQIRTRLRVDDVRGAGEWLDLAGMIVPKGEIVELLRQIEQGEMMSVADIHRRFEHLHEQYYAMEWAWAHAAIERWYDLDLSQVEVWRLIEIVQAWRGAVVGLDEMLYRDARKEFSLVSKTGFGVDGRHERRESDFEQVRGSFEKNPFVKAVEEHIVAKVALAEDLIARVVHLK